MKVDGWMAGHKFICGNRLTMADLLLFAFLDFGAVAGQPIDASLENIMDHFRRIGERPSAAASLEPVANGGHIAA